MTILFPDIEKIIVEFLAQRLPEISDPVTDDVRVGTIKTPPGDAQPEKQVVVTANYTGTGQVMVRDSTATLEVYANDYSTASSLGLLVAAIIVGIPGDHVKSAIVTLGPVRTTEESPAEKRTISVDMMVKGFEI